MSYSKALHFKNSAYQAHFAQGIPAFAYIVCDITDPLKVVLLDRDAQPTPDGLTYYGYHRNHRIYYEVIDYGKVLSDAKKRNRIFFDRLNLLAPK